MRIAFYSPMKPPDHAVPSGDRAMARLLAAALERAGHTVELVSRLGTWCRTPDPAGLAALEREAQAEGTRIAAGWRDAGTRPDLWLTYHLYHKAPDLVGPQVTADLSIPYVAIEASRAARRARDAWRPHFERAERALRAADAVVAVSRHDLKGLEEALPAEKVYLMPPFIDAAAFRGTPRAERAEDGPLALLSAAMMRPGRKADSFRVLADAFRRLLETADLTLAVAGDGPERRTVEAMFRGTPTTFLGNVPHEEMAAVYAGHDLFVWPAIDEPWGIVFLEAQAAGLPVVGSDARGVPDIVAEGVTGLLPPSGDTLGFSAAMASLIHDQARRAAMGAAAREHVARRHDIGAAARWLDDLLTGIVAARGRPAP